MKYNRNPIESLWKYHKYPYESSICLFKLPKGPKPTVAVVSLVCRACSSTPWTERSWISRPRARCETRGVPRVGRRENPAKIYRWPRVNMQQKTWKILEKHMFFVGKWQRINGNFQSQPVSFPAGSGVDQSLQPEQSRVWRPSCRLWCVYTYTSCIIM